MSTPVRRSCYTIAWACLLFLSGCGTIFGPSVDGSPSEIEQTTLSLVNGYRRSLGLAELAWNETLAEAARGHSRDMAEGRSVFGHGGFEERIASIGKSIPWTKIAENVAYTSSAENAVDGWIRSPEHKVNLEGDYRLSGVGAAMNKSGTGFYITQIFVRPRDH
jgi:uncharacterized protein YkwD